MYTLASDEKASAVMIYTRDTLVCGEVVTKQSSRVSVWLRTEGAPEYLHVLNPQAVNFSGTATRVMSYYEMYLPTNQVIGFHLTPPSQDQMDYDDSEKNRMMQPVTVLVGTFVFKGTIRISTQVDLGTSIASGKVIWMSLYDVKITNPQLQQMGEMKVPMLLVRPGQVSYCLRE